MVVVEHDPAISGSVLRAQDVNCEEIGAVYFADEMRGVNIKAVAEVGMDLVISHRSFLHDGSHRLAATDSESDAWGVGSFLTLSAF